MGSRMTQVINYLCLLSLVFVLSAGCKAHTAKTAEEVGPDANDPILVDSEKILVSAVTADSSGSSTVVHLTGSAGAIELYEGYSYSAKIEIIRNHTSDVQDVTEALEDDGSFAIDVTDVAVGDELFTYITQLGGDNPQEVILYAVLGTVSAHPEFYEAEDDTETQEPTVLGVTAARISLTAVSNNKATVRGDPDAIVGTEAFAATLTVVRSGQIFANLPVTDSYFAEDGSFAIQMNNVMAGDEVTLELVTSESNVRFTIAGTLATTDQSVTVTQTSL